MERHIYRTGGSENTRLMGKKVRLRDIRSLFLDTGLGRDSFSITSQGRSEEIFNSNLRTRALSLKKRLGLI